MLFLNLRNFVFANFYVKFGFFTSTRYNANAACPTRAGHNTATAPSYTETALYPYTLLFIWHSGRIRILLLAAYPPETRRIGGPRRNSYPDAHADPASSGHRLLQYFARKNKWSAHI